MVGARTSRVWGPLLAVILSLALAGGYLLVAHERGWLDRALCEGECPVDGPIDDLDVAAVSLEPPAEIVPLSAEAVDQALGTLLEDERLGSVSLTVHDLATGDLAFASGEQALIPASSQKVLTAFAALEVLGPDDRFTTSVRLDGDTVVLVGGGDPLLADEAEEDGEHASLEELARSSAEALAERGIDQVSVAYDASYFSSPDWHPEWPERYRQSGVGSRMSALRLPPSPGPDVQDPTADAAEAFAAYLEDAGIATQGEPSEAAGDDAGDLLVEQEGARVAEAVERSILVSDNYVTEVLGHHLAMAQGREPEHVEAAEAVEEAVVRALGPQEGLAVVDTSGLSRDNRVSTQTLASVIRAAADEPRYAPLFEALPIAGYSGSLGSRFADEATEDGVGLVRAKTGTLTGVRSLTGVVTTVDGGAAAFSLIANDIGEQDQVQAVVLIDEALAALAACDCT